MTLHEPCVVAINDMQAERDRARLTRDAALAELADARASEKALRGALQLVVRDMLAVDQRGLNAKLEALRVLAGDLS